MAIFRLKNTLRIHSHTKHKNKNFTIDFFFGNKSVAWAANEIEQMIGVDTHKTVCSFFRYSFIRIMCTILNPEVYAFMRVLQAEILASSFVINACVCDFRGMIVNSAGSMWYILWATIMIWKSCYIFEIFPFGYSTYLNQQTNNRSIAVCSMYSFIKAFQTFLCE